MSRIDKNTILMLHMNDNTFKDECGHTITNNGVILDTVNKKFGNGSAYANNKVLKIESDDMIFNTNDFTIDFWMYYISGYSGCSSAYTGTTGTGIILQPDIISIGSSMSFYKIASSGNFIENEWVHYALVRHSNVFYYFVNGKLINSLAQNIIITNNKFCINSRYSSLDNYTGIAYYDEFRISNIARWTENFIPPIKEYSEDKYLIKQQNKYYSIKDGSPIELGIPTDDVQLEQWFNNNGIDDINNLCTKYNIEKYTSSGETLGNGKLFTFNVPNNMKNINNVD